MVNFLICQGSLSCTVESTKMKTFFTPRYGVSTKMIEELNCFQKVSCVILYQLLQFLPGGGFVHYQAELSVKGWEG